MRTKSPPWHAFVYEVEDYLKRATVDGKEYIWIKWVGYDEPTCEPVGNAINFQGVKLAE